LFVAPITKANKYISAVDEDGNALPYNLPVYLDGLAYAGILKETDLVEIRDVGSEGDYSSDSEGEPEKESVLFSLTKQAAGDEHVEKEIKSGRLSVMPGKDGVPRASVALEKGAIESLNPDYMVSKEDGVAFQIKAAPEGGDEIKDIRMSLAIPSKDMKLGGVKRLSVAVAGDIGNIKDNACMPSSTSNEIDIPKNKRIKRLSDDFELLKNPADPDNKD